MLYSYRVLSMLGLAAAIKMDETSRLLPGKDNLSKSTNTIIYQLESFVFLYVHFLMLQLADMMMDGFDDDFSVFTMSWAKDLAEGYHACIHYLPKNKNLKNGTNGNKNCKNVLHYVVFDAFRFEISF